MNEFLQMIGRFTAAVKANDGRALADLFTPDGYYADVFYGRYQGRDQIAAMLGRFHAEGSDFEWEMHEPLTDGRLAYMHWTFSFTSQAPKNAGQRVLMRGASRLLLKDGLIEAYDEWCYDAAALVGAGVPAAALEKSLLRRDAAHRAAADKTRHRV